jgi:hypothetical protein
MKFDMHWMKAVKGSFSRKECPFTRKFWLMGEKS